MEGVALASEDEYTIVVVMAAADYKIASGNVYGSASGASSYGDLGMCS